ncbi:unnamed protein product, partial [Hapterophycus canaliculatus]
SKRVDNTKGGSFLSFLRVRLRRSQSALVNSRCIARGFRSDFVIFATFGNICFFHFFTLRRGYAVKGEDVLNSCHHVQETSCYTRVLLNFEDVRYHALTTFVSLVTYSSFS